MVTGFLFTLQNHWTQAIAKSLNLHILNYDNNKWEKISGQPIHPIHTANKKIDLAFHIYLF